MGCGRTSNMNLIIQPFQRITKDYTELEDQFSGQGVKKTKSWKALITKKDLKIKRQEFWDYQTKTNRKKSWVYLKQIVESSESEAKVLLSIGKFKTLDSSMNICISPKGHRYEIPSFVLVDPLEFADEIKGEILKKNIPEDLIAIKLRMANSVTDFDIKLSNSSTIKNLKSLIFQHNEGFKDQDLKFFFNGRLLQDHNELRDYGITNDMVITLYITKIFE
ncbi:hypothetical protein SteCoe_28924 [Stentor coeruleus]|uniref:Ubiquitin-like domain-containing protein n=1 Tax=Stentor coeruleus TaxID=5963 RepID=A0A1R2B712_9CILI|nr:hypothetical protein SteCoe_28924 [Stentor coeruleus]